MKRIRRNYSFPDQVYDRLGVLAGWYMYGNRSAMLALLIDRAYHVEKKARGKK